jgi:hypothetical protein
VVALLGVAIAAAPSELGVRRLRLEQRDLEAAAIDLRQNQSLIHIRSCRRR